MEVHHHPQIGHHKKMVKEYFLEFLMIFMAVVLGFFAESIREKISDHNKEKDYIRSLILNIKDDTSSLEQAIDQNLQKEEGIKKVVSLSFRSMSIDSNRSMLYKYCRGKSVGFYSLFKSNDATMVQLKSEGLRFIHKDHVAESIAKYDNEVKIIYWAEDLHNKAIDAGIMATPAMY